jgi:hypothetical protein
VHPLDAEAGTIFPLFEKKSWRNLICPFKGSGGLWILLIALKILSIILS